MQEFGHEVGAGRCHHDGVGLSAQVDVRHVVGLTRIPLRNIDRAIGQGLQRDWCDELGRSLRHHHLHRRPSFD